jgi:hypothetical protein
MKIRFSAGNTVLTATMLDNETSRDFMSLLPLTVTFKDYAGTEKITYLPRRLSTKGAPAGTNPSVGDIAYYAPWGNVAIFYRDFGMIRNEYPFKYFRDWLFLGFLLFLLFPEGAVPPV